MGFHYWLLLCVHPHSTAAADRFQDDEENQQELEEHLYDLGLLEEGTKVINAKLHEQISWLQKM